jgi:hypothetical protein
MRSGKEGNLHAFMKIEEKQGALAHGLLQTKHNCSPIARKRKCQEQDVLLTGSTKCKSALQENVLTQKVKM